MAMMALGMFVFTLKTAPYQQMQHDTGWRHPSQSRVGLRPVRQFIGPDDESITLSGLLLPEISGGRLSLSMLRLMADQGMAWPLIDGGGWIHGLFVIETLSETSSIFFKDGAPARIEFTLGLKRVDDGLIDLLGRVSDSLQGLF